MLDMFNKVARLAIHNVRRDFTSIILALSFAASPLQEIQAAATNSASPSKTVLSTTTFLHDLVKIIGADAVTSKSLMGPGVDPHLYKASARDLRKIKDADLVFAIGLHLEGRIYEVLKQMQSRGHSLIFVGDLLPKSSLFDADPHVWFDPSLWILASQHVRDSLSKLVPNQKEQFNSRQKKWETNVLKATAEFKIRLESIPTNKRVLITSHDAFRYWGRAFNVQVKAIQGISTDSEASLKHMKDLATQIRNEKIPAVFIESSVSPASIIRLKTIASIKIGGELFGDSLGGPQSPGPTYIKALRHNTETFIKAFQ